MSALNTGELSWVKQINILVADGVRDTLTPRVILVPSASFCGSLSVKWLQASRDYLASALQRPEMPENIYCPGAALDQWKGVRQGCILSPCLFNLYAEYITRNAGLEEAQAGIKIAGRNISRRTSWETAHWGRRSRTTPRFPRHREMRAFVSCMA